MEKSKVYTRTGDKGFTSLVGGTRVSKTHIRLDAYGTVDELNSFIGLLIEEIEDANERKILLHIQSVLFSAGGLLATEGMKTAHCIGQSEIALLESEIDRMDAFLPKLNRFILPGGSRGAALAHVCRTICRRAERCIYGIPEVAATGDDTLLVFMNRLSDYFFVLARKLCFDKNGEEIFWDNPCK